MCPECGVLVYHAGCIGSPGLGYERLCCLGIGSRVADTLRPDAERSCSAQGAAAVPLAANLGTALDRGNSVS